jgi:hypothetical protein
LPRQGLALCGFFDVWHDYLQKCHFKRTSSFGEVKPGGRTREPGGALAVAVRLVDVTARSPLWLGVRRRIDERRSSASGHCRMASSRSSPRSPF